MSRGKDHPVGCQCPWCVRIADDRHRVGSGEGGLVDRFGPGIVDQIEFIIDTLDELGLVIERGETAFRADVLLQRAVEGSVNRIGDAIRNKIPVELQDEYGGQAMWSEWVAWRVFLTHVYHRITLHRVWRDLTTRVPEFRRFLVDEVLGSLGS